MTAAGLNHPTVFELETAIAFEYFKERNCDYVMLETGMGGDLDSTNVIKSPLVCAFASISMDHIGILGNTLREIATCKSGIIKPGAAVVTGPQDSEAMEVLEAAAQSMGCHITHTEDCIRKEHTPEGQTFLYKGREYFVKLLGRHQLRNAAVAIEVASALQKTGASRYGREHSKRSCGNPLARSSGDYPKRFQNLDSGWGSQRSGGGMPGGNAPGILAGHDVHRRYRRFYGIRSIRKSPQFSATY